MQVMTDTVAPMAIPAPAAAYITPHPTGLVACYAVSAAMCAVLTAFHAEAIAGTVLNICIAPARTATEPVKVLVVSASSSIPRASIYAVTRSTAEAPCFRSPGVLISGTSSLSRGVPRRCAP